MNDVPIEVRPAPTPGQLIYDCTPWAGESRRLLRSMFEVHGLKVSWQGTEVLVLEEDRESADELVEQVLRTTASTVGSESAAIVYEVNTWPAALQTEFTDQLTISEVEYVWDPDGNVVVDQTAEELVDEVLEMLPDPDDFDDTDGFEAQGRLNEAFRLCDRLASRPAEVETLGRLREVSGLLGSMSPPFGFEQRDWDGLVEQVAEVAAEEKISDKNRSKRAKVAKKLLLNYV